jgi:hypothetical protein
LENTSVAQSTQLFPADLQNPVPVDPAEGQVVASWVDNVAGRNTLCHLPKKKKKKIEVQLVDVDLL